MGFPQYRQDTPRNMIRLVAASMLDSNRPGTREDSLPRCYSQESGTYGTYGEVLARGSAQVFAHAAKGRLN
jgi:hypothetical protein